MYEEDYAEGSSMFADDEEYDSACGLNHLGLTLEKTAAGEKFTQETVGASAVEKYLLCMFEGKIALGFGEGFVGNQSNRFELLGSVLITGNEGTVDSLMSRNSKSRPVARIYNERITSSKNILFILVDQYGLPSSLVPEVSKQVEEFITISKQVVIFHSEPIAYLKTDKSMAKDKLFYIKSSDFNDCYLKSLTALPLPTPNMISGVGAAVVLHCEMVEKPSALLISYHENEIVDSISMRPFVRATQKKSGSSSEKGDLIDIGECFSQLVHSVKRSTQCNLNHISETNLYV